MTIKISYHICRKDRGKLLQIVTDFLKKMDV